MIVSLKNKILVWFVFFSLFLLSIVISLNSHYYKKREERNNLIDRFVRVEKMLITIFNNSNAFFSSEITNPAFFETGESVYLQKNDTLIKIVFDDLESLRNISSSQKININSETDTIMVYITEFNVIFRQIVNLMHQRGYKDYGVEGEMRSQIHKLEELNKIDQTDVLMLRRHEKDYIIRHENLYVDKLYVRTEEFKQNIAQSQFIDKKQKDSVIRILDNYKLLFNKIVSLEQQLGIHDNSSLKKQLDDLSIMLENHIEKLISKVNREKQILLNEARITYFFEILLTVLLSSVISLMITRKVTGSLIRLTQDISNLRKDDFDYLPITYRKNTDAEILMIYNEFNHLIEHLDKREKQRDVALNELKIQELRYRLMADMLPVSIFETGTDNNFTYLNKKFEETFGYRKEEWQNLKLSDIINDSKVIEELNFSRSLSSVETFGKKKNDTTFPILFYCSENYQENRLIGIKGIIVDITDRVAIIKDLQKAKIKAEESDRLKTAFLANMSHEIRTPMNAIIGYSELLNAELPSDTGLSDYINQIQSSGKLLIKIIDDILDIAKIESGELSIVIEEFEIDPLMEDLYQHFQGIINMNNHQIKFLLTKNISERVVIRSDPFRIRQIFNNLINNAVKFTHEGYIEIGYDQESDYIRFFVKDSGIGIPALKQNIVFERFRQADESTTRQYGGTGLGLSIVKNLVELLGGTMNLVSEEGRGSEFSFKIPYEEIQPKQARSFLSEPIIYQKKPLTWGTYTLLIVENDFASRQLLIHILKPTGIRILTAINGIEAVEKFLKNEHINIILMDIQMPGENGFEVTRKIRKFNSRIPIIAQTAYAMAEEHELCIKAGCTDYLTKPIIKNELLTKISKYLEIYEVEI